MPWTSSEEAPAQWQAHENSPKRTSSSECSKLWGAKPRSTWRANAPNRNKRAEIGPVPLVKPTWAITSTTKAPLQKPPPLKSSKNNRSQNLQEWAKSWTWSTPIPSAQASTSRCSTWTILFRQRVTFNQAARKEWWTKSLRKSQMILRSWWRRHLTFWSLSNWALLPQESTCMWRWHIIQMTTQSSSSASQTSIISRSKNTNWKSWRIRTGLSLYRGSAQVIRRTRFWAMLRRSLPV